MSAQPGGRLAGAVHTALSHATCMSELSAGPPPKALPGLSPLCFDTAELWTFKLSN